MTHSYSIRPRPLWDALKGRGAIISGIGGAVSIGLTWGVITNQQASAVNALLAAIPGVISLATGLFAAFGVVRQAEPLVTPVASPRDNQGRELAPVIPDPEPDTSPPVF